MRTTPKDYAKVPLYSASALWRQFRYNFYMLRTTTCSEAKFMYHCMHAGQL